MPPSDRHRELISQARSQQRAKQQRAKPKPVPRQIGQRDRVTGDWTAIYPDQSLTAKSQKAFDAVSKPGEQVKAVSTPLGFTLLGAKGEHLTLAIPDQIIYRSQVTPGPLKTNEVGYLKGQVFSYPKKKRGVGGMFMWLDCNWLWFEPLPGRPSGFTPESFEFFYAMLKSFGQRVIYTLPDSDPRIHIDFEDTRATLSDPQVALALQAKGITVRYAPPGQAKGVYFLPLLRSSQTLEKKEFAALRAIGKQHGLLICGDFNTFVPLDNRLLRGLEIRSEVVATGTSSVGDYGPYVGVNGFTDFSVTGDGYSHFEGLRDEEVVAQHQANGKKLFAYFKL